MCNTFSNCNGKAGTLTVAIAYLEKGQQRIYLVKANLLISGIYGIVMNFVGEFLPFHPFLARMDGSCPSRTIPVGIFPLDRIESDLDIEKDHETMKRSLAIS